MFSKFIKVRLVAFLTVLVLPGGVFAAECLTATLATADLAQNPLDPGINPEETGYAISIQSDQGQGAISCADFQGQFGPMVPLPITQQGGNGSLTSRTVWTIADPNGPSADLVFAASSDGSRCTQFYAGNASSGYAAAGSKGNKPRILIACTDEKDEELPPEPIKAPEEPDLTEAGCPEDFQTAINIPGDEWDVMILNGSAKGTAGGEGRSAICIDQTLNGGNPNDPNPPALNRCANRCIVPDAANDPNWIPFDDLAREPGGNCTETGPSFIATGRFPIACRVCELSSIVQSDFFEPDLQFCWEQGQDVNLVDNTFKFPPPDQGNQGWDVNGKFGSTCYLISGKTRSGYPYSYWAPSGCPN